MDIVIKHYFWLRRYAMYKPSEAWCLAVNRANGTHRSKDVIWIK